MIVKKMIFLMMVIFLSSSFAGEDILFCDQSNYLDYIFDKVKTEELVERTGRGCQLRGLRLPVELDLRGAIFFHADLRAAYLPNWDLRNTDFREADLRHALLVDADFRQANLMGANFDWAKLMGADFRQADLTGASLYAFVEGVKWEGAILPKDFFLQTKKGQ